MSSQRRYYLFYEVRSLRLSLSISSPSLSPSLSLSLAICDFSLFTLTLSHFSYRVDWAFSNTLLNSTVAWLDVVNRLSNSIANSKKQEMRHMSLIFGTLMAGAINNGVVKDNEVSESEVVQFQVIYTRLTLPDGTLITPTRHVTIP